MTYDIFIEPFKKYAIMLVALFVFCITYSIHKDVTLKSLEENIQYQNFVQKSIKNQRLETILGLSVSNEKDVQIVTEQILSVTKLQKESPDYKKSLLQDYKQSLVTTLYQMKKNSGIMLTENSRKELSKKFNFYTFKIKHVSSDVFLFITELLTLCLFFSIYFSLYHSLIRKTILDNHNLFESYDPNCFIINTKGEVLDKLKNQFKITVSIFAVMGSVIISIMLLPIIFFI